MKKEQQLEILAIIPARGGSKGIPHKNIKSLNGKPLLVYSIEAALRTHFVTRLIVSTDDPEIARIALQHGTEVIERPPEISGDDISSEAVLLHVLDYLEDRENYTPELTVFLQCTAPLTLAEDIDGTIQALIDENAASSVAVVPFHYFLWRVESDRNAVGINHDKNIRTLRQKQAPQYLEAGSVYVMRTSLFRDVKHRFFGHTAIYIMPQERRHEIDDWIDFTIAEVLVREQEKRNIGALLPEPISAIIFDFDGVFTDNQVMISEQGQETVSCNRSDGIGITRLRSLGIPMLVISTEKNPVVKIRCDKLGLECFFGIDDKLSILNIWLREHNINLANTVFVGNDINDLACLSAVGCGVTVRDASTEVQGAARIVLSSLGGKGAVREIADLITNRVDKKE